VRRRSYQLAWAPGQALGASAALLRDWLIAASPTAGGAPGGQPRGAGSTAARRATRRRA